MKHLKSIAIILLAVINMFNVFWLGHTKMQLHMAIQQEATTLSQERVIIEQEQELVETCKGWENTAKTVETNYLRLLAVSEQSCAAAALMGYAAAQQGVDPEDFIKATLQTFHVTNGVSVEISTNQIAPVDVHAQRRKL